MTRGETLLAVGLIALGLFNAGLLVWLVRSARRDAIEGWKEVDLYRKDGVL